VCGRPKGAGAVANGFRGIKKCVGVVSLYLQLQLHAPGYLNIPTDKKLMECGRANLESVPRDLTFSGHNFFPWFWHGLVASEFFQAF